METSNNYFNSIGKYKIEFIHENEHSEDWVKSKGNSELLSKIDSNNNLVFYVNKASYKNSINNIDKNSDEHKLLEMKYKLFSLNLNGKTFITKKKFY